MNITRLNTLNDDKVIVKGNGGGSTTPTKLQRNDVNFFDYDGTLLYSYSWDEAKELTELPALPIHNGLEVREWNYTLEDIKEQGTETTIGKADVGACCYDGNGEQIEGFGVRIIPRGVTSTQYLINNSVFCVVSIPNTVSYIADSTISNAAILHELKIPISVDDVQEYYCAFRDGCICGDIWWNGNSRELDFVHNTQISKPYIILTRLLVSVIYLSHIALLDSQRLFKACGSFPVKCFMCFMILAKQ